MVIMAVMLIWKEFSAFRNGLFEQSLTEVLSVATFKDVKNGGGGSKKNTSLKDTPKFKEESNSERI